MRGCVSARAGARAVELSAPCALTVDGILRRVLVTSSPHSAHGRAAAHRYATGSGGSALDSQEELEEIAARIGSGGRRRADIALLQSLSPTAEVDRTPSPLVPLPRHAAPPEVSPLPEFNPFRGGDSVAYTPGAGDARTPAAPRFNAPTTPLVAREAYLRFANPVLPHAAWPGPGQGRDSRGSVEDGGHGHRSSSRRSSASGAGTPGADRGGGDGSVAVRLDASGGGGGGGAGNSGGGGGGGHASRSMSPSDSAVRSSRSGTKSSPWSASRRLTEHSDTRGDAADGRSSAELAAMAAMAAAHHVSGRRSASPPTAASSQLTTDARSSRRSVTGTQTSALPQSAAQTQAGGGSVHLVHDVRQSEVEVSGSRRHREVVDRSGGGGDSDSPLNVRAVSPQRGASDGRGAHSSSRHRDSRRGSPSAASGSERVGQHHGSGARDGASSFSSASERHGDGRGGVDESTFFSSPPSQSQSTYDALYGGTRRSSGGGGRGGRGGRGDTSDRGDKERRGGQSRGSSAPRSVRSSESDRGVKSDIDGLRKEVAALRTAVHSVEGCVGAAAHLIEPTRVL